MTSLAPSLLVRYIHQAERYIHPSMAFALGYMQLYAAYISLPTELISANILISYWFDLSMTTAQTAGFLVLLIAICVSINFLGARAFGESEFWCVCHLLPHPLAS